MSALEDEVALHVEARAHRLAVCSRAWGRGHPDDRRENMRQLALGATECLTSADVVLLRLEALGVNVVPLRAALDAAHEAVLRATIPVLAETRADTPEQAEGRKTP